MVNPDKITVIPNGIDIKRFLNKDFQIQQPKQKSSIVLGALGRLEIQKNFEFLIPVAIELKKGGFLLNF